MVLALGTRNEEPTMSRTRHPFAVRKVVSGYTGWDSYIVVQNPGGRRVSVHASTRECAQADADQLNIGAMVKDYVDDPRPYDVRRAEAEKAYRAEVGR
jgi:hypothetical protein